MKKRLLLLACLILIGGCAILKKPQEPKASIASISIDSINLTRVKVLVGLDIYNPNDYNIGVNDIDYKISLRGSTLLEDSLSPKASLLANQDTRVNVPVFVDVFQAMNLIGPFMRAKKNPTFLVEGKIKLKNILLPIKFKQKKTLDLNDPKIRQYLK